MEVDTSSNTQQIFADSTEKLNGDKIDCQQVAGEENGQPLQERVPPEETSPRDDGSSDLSNRNVSNGGGRRKRSRRKHKAGRHHNRKWKPYDKLTWEERKVLSDRETRRANMKREELFAAGQPMAPYNTTQFLMEQHEGSYDGFQEKLVEGARPSRERGAEGCDAGSGSPDSSEDYCQSEGEEEDFNHDEKDFAEAYENFHAERLQSLTKDELIREYIELEAKTESMEKRLKDVGESPTSDKNPVFPDDSASDEPSGLPKLSYLEAEIKKLREVNSSLKRENELLRNGPKSV